MKCIECGHEQGFHNFDEKDSPCVLRDCACIGYREPQFVDRHLALREAVNIVQAHQAKQSRCKACEHDLDRHNDRPYLPIDDIVGAKIKNNKYCAIPGCGCEDFL